ncbi:hypothetical protein ACP6ZN_002191 [Enterobacter cloacae]
MGEITVMAKNDFKPFATGAGANVMSQADWEALPALLTGFQSGKASSAQMNKAFRQASFIASGIAQFVCNASGQDVLDDGNLASFIAKLSAGFDAQYSGRLIRTTVLTSTQSFTKDSKMKFCRVRIIGGGGASGGAQATSSTTQSISGGAGAGAYAEVIFNNSDIPSILSVTIGSGGVPVGTSGSDGGTSSFGSLISCPGGKATLVGTLVSTSATSGVVSGSQVSDAPTISAGKTLCSERGAGGSIGIIASGAILGGNGASSPLGTGSAGRGAGVAPLPTTGYGAGGAGYASGVSSAAANGVAGTSGVCIIEEYA